MFSPLGLDFVPSRNWAVGQEAKLRQGEAEVERIYDLISEWGRVKEEPRMCQWWALAIFCAGKVCWSINEGHLVIAHCRIGG